MSTNQRSADSVYGEIAGLTGNRAELERERFMLIKAIRAMRALRDDSAMQCEMPDDVAAEFDAAIERLTAIKGKIWTAIEKTDRDIQRLTDLVQNGAFND